MFWLVVGGLVFVVGVVVCFVQLRRNHARRRDEQLNALRKSGALRHRSPTRRRLDLEQPLSASLPPATTPAEPSAFESKGHQVLPTVAARESSGEPSADVFISYKREERARVEIIADALHKAGFSVWFDAHLEPGSTFDSEISRQVRGAKCVLVCWSRASVESDWVRSEAAEGRRRRALVACFLEPCDPSVPFNLVHAEDLSSGVLDRYNPAWVKIVSQIGRHAGQPDLSLE
jgi:hypothetical protein